MFLSAVWTLILTAPIHRESIGEQVMLHFSESVPMKKQTHIHIGLPVDKYALQYVLFMFYV